MHLLPKVLIHRKACKNLLCTTLHRNLMFVDSSDGRPMCCNYIQVKPYIDPSKLLLPHIEIVLDLALQQVPNACCKIGVKAQHLLQVLCDVFTHSGSLVLLEAAGTAWKKLADAIMNAGQLSMRQELLLKPVIHMLKTCHTPDAYQACSLPEN